MDTTDSVGLNGPKLLKIERNMTKIRPSMQLLCRTEDNRWLEENIFH